MAIRRDLLNTKKRDCAQPQVRDSSKRVKCDHTAPAVAADTTLTDQCIVAQKCNIHLFFHAWHTNCACCIVSSVSRESITNLQYVRSDDHPMSELELPGKVNNDHHMLPLHVPNYLWYDRHDYD
jgi:hypothetical protein